jgi:beta-lactamase superfamily II metal-dependent hydrolase
MSIEIEFLPVGDDSGDAICIRYGNALQGYHMHVVDGGYTATSDTIIKHIEQFYGRDTIIEHMVLSHADDDHATGLAKVVEHFPVANIWMNRPWLFVRETIQHFHKGYGEEGLYKKMRDLHPYLIDIEDAAASKLYPPQIHDVFQGAQIGAFTVLAPSRDRYVQMIPDLEKTPQSYAAEAQKTILGGFLSEALKRVTEYVDENWSIETLPNNPQPPTSYSNESSVVQYGFYEGKRIMLTADVGPVGLNEAVDYAIARGFIGHLDFIQVPHHGSRHNVTPNVLDRLLGNVQDKNAPRRGIAMASVGNKKLEYPRPQVVNAFKRRGYPIWTMRNIAMCMPFNIDHRPGWRSPDPEPFRDRFEA